MKSLRLAAALIAVCVICLAFALPAQAQRDVKFSRGQTVYVPVYSHIYYGDKETPYLLAATVSIRNIDQKTPITIVEANYYDTEGKLMKRYVEKPLLLGANSSTRFVVKESDTKGGSGANFVVTWKSDKAANSPILESIMIGTRNQQGISFTSRGQTIEDVGR